MSDTATDWTRYYEKPFITAHVTRRITAHRIVKMVLAAGGFPDSHHIIELGGGNSSFCDRFPDSNPKHPPWDGFYTVVDSNPRGTLLFWMRHPDSYNYTNICADVLTLDPSSLVHADLVFSVGLVEHFSEEQTKLAIRRHFELTKPDGLVLITFPVPTLTYRIIRRAAEMLGIWRFPDEHPIQLEDAVALCAEHGEIIEKRLNRAILLTQGIVLARKPR